MFNTRGGFPGQRPMGPPRMNQPGLNHLGMNMSGMNMSGMNMSGMGMSSMNQPNMNLSGMNQPNMNLSGMNQPNMNLSGMNQPTMNTGMPRMGHPGMNTNVGLANVTPPGVNVYRMGPTGINQGGMGFQPEIKGQGFGMRPMDSPGSYLGGSSEPMGMKSMPMRTPPERHMGPQAVPQRFPSSNPMTPAQPRMIMQNQEIPSIVNRVLQHSSDHMRANPKTPLQEPSHLMEKKPINPLTMFGNLSQEMGMKPGPSSSLEQMSNPQNRYTNESASSILESFGLSNEDLEELSRYPDEQLTPANLPNILRDIRLRKINRSGGSHDQGGGGGRRQGGDVLPSKVIDYGHSSKYQYKDNAAPFDSSRTGQKPPPASKEPAPSSGNKNGKGKIAMDNKIPTISSSRKTTWPGSKSDRSTNNKTLVGEQTTAKTSDGSVTVLKKESPVITIKPDSSALCDVPVISDTVTTSPSNMAAESPIETVVSQVNYPPPAEATTPTAKGSWVPAMSQDEAQKMKRMPTPSMMNDYFAASPRIFPHICSLCNVECRHLKDWIKHQNNTSHIESCRKLRQQYPDWNPQVHTLRNDTKKDETTPKRSRSKSGSPRRSRRSGSRSRARRTRSRSPRSGRRSRSRSPRRIRHSPRQSHSPRKGARSPRRSPSPRRIRRGRSSTPPDKRAVDAAVQSFIEASKLKSGEKPRSTSDVKKLPTISASSNVKGKKPASGSTPTKSSSIPAKKTSGSTSGSSSKKPESSSSVKSGSSSNGTASRSAPKKPLPSTKKPVVSSVVKKTTSSTASTKKPPIKTSSAQKGPKQPASESYNPLNKFTSKSGSDKIIHVTNLPDSGYTDQDILKMVQPFGKVCDILIVRSKNEAFLETNFKEAAAAAVKFSETVPVMINGKRAVLALAGRHKEQAKRETKGTSDAESERSSHQKAAPAKEQKVGKPLKEEKAVKDEKTHKVEKGKKKAEVPKHDIEVPPGFIKCHRLSDPPIKEAEKCVVVISNLPEKQYTVEEVTNLAKPFGGVNDILIITNYRKAYLELPSRNSVDSMLKFYSVFPTCLSGSTLNIAMAAAYKDLKDENRIFAEIIEQASFKIIPTIYEKFVHLSNLPEKEIQEFELTRIGLRFGKVEHYVLLSNKRKAILHMNSPGAANGMHTFLSRFPARIGESVLKCTLVSKPKLSENEYITYLEEKKSSEPDHNMYEEVSSTPDVSQLEEEQPASGTHIAETDVKVSGAYSNVEVEDDDDDEEAAEAPEAPDTPSCFIQPEPVVVKPVYSEVPQSYVTEESDVLVSVESDEECDAPCTDEPNAIPVMDCVSMERLLTAEDSESENNDMETSANDCPKPVDDQNYLALEQKPKDEGNELHGEASQTPDTTAEPLVGKESENTSVVINPPIKEGTSPPRAEESSDKDTKSESGRSPRDGRNKRSEEAANSHDEKSRQRRGRSRQSSHGKPTDELVAATEESKDTEQAAQPGKSPVTRTTKYNPQRGELSITLTVDSQKSSSRVPDSKKRVSGEKGPSGKESTIPKSSSNRSSPSESASASNPKTSAGSYQTKSSHRGTSSQDRDSKVGTRSRDNDSRSNRKDDRSKDSNSSSSRHMRSSARSTRGQRSKEEGEDTFPFNLDEFVTVDEILEDHTDSTKEEKDEERKSQVIGKDQTPKRGGKRKDAHPPASDTKKPKEASGDTQEPSFVTLDEVGDEEDNTPTPESTKDEAAPSQVKEDEVHAEDKVDAVVDSTPSTKEPCVLMTLDEVSDDDEPNASAMPSGSSTIPDKDQLLTLDEISGEDEEQTSHSEPSNPDKWVPQEMEAKEGNSSADPETKENPEVPDVPPQEPDEESHTEQPLLTLDEVKADDDDEEEDSLADMEHHFLTVDEIGEEEDDSVVKEEDVEEPQPKSASKPRQTKRKTSPKLSQPEPKTPAGRRGRPRKRPLSETTPDNKDTSKQTNADSGTVNETPTKPKSKATKGAEQAAKGTEQAEANSSTMTTPDKPGSGTSETPAKKTKLETPSSEKTKLDAFNSSVPVGLDFLVPKTGYFCELCSLFYMDDASKIKHCKSLRHYQALQKHFAKEEKMEEEKSPST